MSGAGFGPGLLHLHLDTTGEYNGGSQNLITHCFFCRLCFPGESVLINHGSAVNNHAIHGNCLTCADHQHICLANGLQRRFHFDAIHQQPNCTRLLAQGVRDIPTEMIFGAIDKLVGRGDHQHRHASGNKMSTENNGKLGAHQNNRIGQPMFFHQCLVATLIHGQTEPGDKSDVDRC